MTLLSICQDITDELPTEKPSTIVGNTNETARLLLASVKAAAKSLYKEHDWLLLTKEHTFTTTASTEDYDMPADYGRLVFDTAWDRDNYNSLKTSLSPQQWQARKSSILGNTPSTWKRFRIRGSSGSKVFSVYPTPDVTGETLVYEYVSNNIIQDADSNFQSEFDADSNTFVLDEELLRLGAFWRVLKRLGMAYAEEKFEYDTELAKAKANDGGMKVLSITQTDNFHLLDGSNVPDTGFGS